MLLHNWATDVSLTVEINSRLLGLEHRDMHLQHSGKPSTFLWHHAISSSDCVYVALGAVYYLGCTWPSTGGLSEHWSVWACFPPTVFSHLSNLSDESQGVGSPAIAHGYWLILSPDGSLCLWSSHSTSVSATSSSEPKDCWKAQRMTQLLYYRVTELAAKTIRSIPMCSQDPMRILQSRKQRHRPFSVILSRRNWGKSVSTHHGSNRTVRLWSLILC